MSFGFVNTIVNFIGNLSPKTIRDASMELDSNQLDTHNSFSQSENHAEEYEINLQKLRKVELRDVLDKHGIPYEKGWTKSILVHLVLQNKIDVSDIFDDLKTLDTTESDAMIQSSQHLSDGLLSSDTNTGRNNVYNLRRHNPPSVAKTESAVEALLTKMNLEKVNKKRKVPFEGDPSATNSNTSIGGKRKLKSVANGVKLISDQPKKIGARKSSTLHSVESGPVQNNERKTEEKFKELNREPMMKKVANNSTETKIQVTTPPEKNPVDASVDSFVDLNTAIPTRKLSISPIPERSPPHASIESLIHPNTSILTGVQPLAKGSIPEHGYGENTQNDMDVDVDGEEADMEFEDTNEGDYLANEVAADISQFKDAEVPHAMNSSPRFSYLGDIFKWFSLQPVATTSKKSVEETVEIPMKKPMPVVEDVILSKPIHQLEEVRELERAEVQMTQFIDSPQNISIPSLQQSSDDKMNEDVEPIHLAVDTNQLPSGELKRASPVQIESSNNKETVVPMMITNAAAKQTYEVFKKIGVKLATIVEHSSKLEEQENNQIVDTSTEIVRDDFASALSESEQQFILNILEKLKPTESSKTSVQLPAKAPQTVEVQVPFKQDLAVMEKELPVPLKPSVEISEKVTEKQMMPINRLRSSFDGGSWNSRESFMPEWSSTKDDTFRESFQSNQLVPAKLDERRRDYHNLYQKELSGSKVVNSEYFPNSSVKKRSLWEIDTDSRSEKKGRLYEDTPYRKRFSMESQDKSSALKRLEIYPDTSLDNSHRQNYDYQSTIAKTSPSTGQQLSKNSFFVPTYQNNSAKFTSIGGLPQTNSTSQSTNRSSDVINNSHASLPSISFIQRKRLQRLSEASASTVVANRILQALNSVSTPAEESRKKRQSSSIISSINWLPNDPITIRFNNPNKTDAPSNPIVKVSEIFTDSISSSKKDNDVQKKSVTFSASIGNEMNEYRKNDNSQSIQSFNTPAPASNPLQLSQWSQPIQKSIGTKPNDPPKNKEISKEITSEENEFTFKDPVEMEGLDEESDEYISSNPKTSVIKYNFTPPAKKVDSQNLGKHQNSMVSTPKQDNQFGQTKPTVDALTANAGSTPFPTKRKAFSSFEIIDTSKVNDTTTSTSKPHTINSNVKFDESVASNTTMPKQTSADSISGSSSSSVNETGITNIWSSSFLNDGVKCDMCSVRNKQNAIKCISCESLLPTGSKSIDSNKLPLKPSYGNSNDSLNSSSFDSNKMAPASQHALVPTNSGSGFKFVSNNTASKPSNLMQPANLLDTFITKNDNHSISEASQSTSGSFFFKKTEDSIPANKFSFDKLSQGSDVTVNSVKTTETSDSNNGMVLNKSEGHSSVIKPIQRQDEDHTVQTTSQSIIQESKGWNNFQSSQVSQDSANEQPSKKRMAATSDSVESDHKKFETNPTFPRSMDAIASTNSNAFSTKPSFMPSTATFNNFSSTSTPAISFPTLSSSSVPPRVDPNTNNSSSTCVNSSFSTKIENTSSNPFTSTTSSMFPVQTNVNSIIESANPTPSKVDPIFPTENKSSIKSNPFMFSASTSVTTPFKPSQTTDLKAGFTSNPISMATNVAGGPISFQFGKVNSFNNQSTSHSTSSGSTLPTLLPTNPIAPVPAFSFDTKPTTPSISAGSLNKAFSFGSTVGAGVSNPIPTPVVGSSVGFSLPEKTLPLLPFGSVPEVNKTASTTNNPFATNSAAVNNSTVGFQPFSGSLNFGANLSSSNFSNPKNDSSGITTPLPIPSFGASASQSRGNESPGSAMDIGGSASTGQDLSTAITFPSSSNPLPGSFGFSSNSSALPPSNAAPFGGITNPFSNPSNLSNPFQMNQASVGIGGFQKKDSISSTFGNSAFVNALTTAPTVPSTLAFGSNNSSMASSFGNSNVLAPSAAPINLNNNFTSPFVFAPPTTVAPTNFGGMNVGSNTVVFGGLPSIPSTQSFGSNAGMASSFHIGTTDNKAKPPADRKFVKAKRPPGSKPPPR